MIIMLNCGIDLLTKYIINLANCPSDYKKN